MTAKIRAPNGLSAEARRWWNKLVDEYQITDSGGHLILLTLLEAFDRMREAQRILGKEGLTVKDRFDQTKNHPMTTVERDSRAQVYAGIKQLCLDLEPLNDTIGRPPGR